MGGLAYRGGFFNMIADTPAEALHSQVQLRGGILCTKHTF